MDGKLKPVTDPEILKQLEGDGGLSPVTDPDLLAQLEGTPPPDLRLPPGAPQEPGAARQMIRNLAPAAQRISQTFHQPLTSARAGIESFKTGRPGKGTLEVTRALLEGLFSPFTVPLAALSEAPGVLRQIPETSPVGGALAHGLATGIEAGVGAVNLPIEAGGELVRQGEAGIEGLLDALGIPENVRRLGLPNPEHAQELAHGVSTLNQMAAPLVFLGGAAESLPKRPAVTPEQLRAHLLGEVFDPRIQSRIRRGKIPASRPELKEQVREEAPDAGTIRSDQAPPAPAGEIPEVREEAGRADIQQTPPGEPGVPGIRQAPQAPATPEELASDPIAKLHQDLEEATRQKETATNPRTRAFWEKEETRIKESLPEEAREAAAVIEPATDRPKPLAITTLLSEEQRAALIANTNWGKSQIHQKPELLDDKSLVNANKKWPKRPAEISGLKGIDPAAIKQEEIPEETLHRIMDILDAAGADIKAIAPDGKAMSRASILGAIDDWTKDKGREQTWRAQALIRELLRADQEGVIEVRPAEGLPHQEVAVSDLVKAAFPERQLGLTPPETRPEVPRLAPQEELFTPEQKGQAKTPPGAITSTIPAAEQAKGTMFEPQPPAQPEIFGAAEAAGPAASQMIPIPVSMAPAGEPIRASRIIDRISKELGVPIRSGHAQFRTRAGFYKVKEEVVRNKEANDLAVTSHEIAHHIDKTALGGLQGRGGRRFSAWKKELADLDYDQRKRRTSEGFAEFVRHYLTMDDAAQVAPRFHAYFEGQFLPAHPEVAQALGRMKQSVTQWRQQGAEARVLSQIDFDNKAEIGLGERAQRLGRKFETAWSDQLAPFNHAVKEIVSQSGISLEPRQNPYAVAQYVAKTAPGKARAFVMEGVRDFGLNKVGKSLKEIVEPVAGDIKKALAYAYAKRAIELHNRGINPGITRGDAEYVLSQGKPEYERFASEVTDWNGQIMDYLVDAGGLSKEAAATIRESNLAYIPLKRAFVDQPSAGGSGRGFADLPSPIKRIKGSGREIINPLESMILQTEQIIGVADKTRVARALVDLTERTPGGGKWVEKIKAPQVGDKIGLEDIRRQLEATGADLSNADMDAVLTIYSQGQRYFGKDNIVSIVRNGKREFYELNPELYAAMKGLDKVTLPWFINYTFGTAARATRLGATGLRPGFTLITNWIRDIQTHFLQTEHSSGSPYLAFRGIIRDLGGSEVARQFRAAGGEMAQPLGLDRRMTQTLLDEVLASDAKRKAMNVVRHPIEVAKRLMSFTEAGPRLAEFEAAMRKYDPEIQRTLAAGDNVRVAELRQNAAIEAGNAAADVTVNFRRMGVYSSVTNQIIPFFNPAIQGLTKMGRSVWEHPARSGLKALATMTAPALALWWANKDEDWYRELPDWERMQFWHFKIGQTIVRLPMPFEWGYLFSGLPVAVADALYRKDPKIVSDAMKETAKNLLPIDITDPATILIEPALVKPLAEAYFNRDVFRDRPIVPRSVEGLLPARQSTAHTSAVGKWVGKVLNVSPAKVDHLLAGYSGGLLLDILNALPKEVKEAADIPVVGRLFTRSENVGLSGKSVQEFYKAYDHAQRVKATLVDFMKKTKFEQGENTMDRAKQELGLDEEDLKTMQLLPVMEKTAEMLKLLRNTRGSIRGLPIGEEEKNRQLKRTNEEAAALARTLLR